VLHRHRQFDVHVVELRIQLAGLSVLWLVFIIEALGRLLQRDRREPAWKHLGLFLLVCLVPPVRLGVRSQAPDRALWLPGLGWQVVNRELQRRLERFFSVPMILIALSVLPLLAIEHFGKEQMKKFPGLELFVAVGNSVIWFAFAFEFLLMVSVARKKLQYCTQHWIELAVILIPIVQFLPDFLPLLRLLRAGTVLRLGMYRMQSLALKAWRAVLLLELVQRLTGQSLEKRLRKLQDLLAAKQEEIEELRKEIAYLQKQIALQKQAEAARPAELKQP
ncbi:MAG TPA: hypothetical protein VNK04_15185, partial [Gemmataceae bacterium]|nr:hypothetical protein [Gemmataceae bacterium]